MTYGCAKFVIRGAELNGMEIGQIPLIVGLNKPNSKFN